MKKKSEDIFLEMVLAKVLLLALMILAGFLFYRYGLSLIDFFKEVFQNAIGF